MPVNGVKESLKLQKVTGEASREPVGETSHASHLKLGMEEGRAQGKATSSHSGRLEVSLELQQNSARGSTYTEHI